MSRYFFALWPDSDIRNQLQAVSDRLPDRCGRKVNIKNLHITLVFLGSVEESLLDRIRLETEGVHGRIFTMTLDLYGWWKRPQVIWLGTKTVPAVLVDLAARLNAIAAGHGLKIDSRPYTPHLTLVRKAKRPLAQFSYSPIQWKIRDFCLVQSVTHASGAEYKIIRNWPLT